MRVLRPDQDAFGHLLTDAAAGRRVMEVVERDDGCVLTSDPSYRPRTVPALVAAERRAMRFVRGRVPDVGCGAGTVKHFIDIAGYATVLDFAPSA